MSPKPVIPPPDLVQEQRAKEEQARAIAGRVGKRFGHFTILSTLMALAIWFDYDEAAVDKCVEDLHRQAKADAGPKPRFSKGIPAWEEKVRHAHEALIAREAARFQQEHDDRVTAAEADLKKKRLDEQAEKQDEEHAAEPVNSTQDKPKRQTSKKKPPEQPQDADAEPAKPSDESEAAAE